MPDVAERPNRVPDAVPGAPPARAAVDGGPARDEGPTETPAPAPDCDGPAETQRAPETPVAAPNPAGAGDAERGGAAARFSRGCRPEKAARYLVRMSTIDLRRVLIVLGVQGKMQAKDDLKRSAALAAMQRTNLDDEILEAMVDEVAAAGIDGRRRPAPIYTPGVPGSAGNASSPPPTNGDATRIAGSIAVTGPGTRPAADGTDSSGQPSTSRAACAGGPSVFAQAPTSGAWEAPTFSANDVARIFHVVSDLRHRTALEQANRLLSRAEHDKEPTRLCTSALAPAYNDTSYCPTTLNLIDCIMDVDLGGMSPNRHSGPRNPSKLEAQFRSLRSLYTVALSKYTRSSNNEPIFKRCVRGDHRLLYIQCVLNGNAAPDFVLRTVVEIV